MKIFHIFLCSTVLICPVSVLGVETNVRGKIIGVEGHENPSCRRVFLKRNSDGGVLAFRAPNTGTDQTIIAVSLTGLSLGLDVIIDYDPDITSGCGPEPKIIYNTIMTQ